MNIFTSQTKYNYNKWHYDRMKLIGAHSLFSKDLYAHYGCVNAVDFSSDGELLASGSDDRRVLLWNCEEILRSNNVKPYELQTRHLSNIFCLKFDHEKKSMFSAGNDESLIEHDVSTGRLVRPYCFDEPVYSIDTPKDGEPIFATASENGHVEILDTRDFRNRFELVKSHGSFHGVAINPVDTRIIATANSIDGVRVYDKRFYKEPLLNFGSTKRSNSSESKGTMSVCFNYTGRKLLALQRKNVPTLYDIINPDEKINFSKGSYKNMVTMKSGCFVGDKDQFVISGSDDFCLYLWRIPDNSENEIDGCPYMILRGHRSIANNVRYNRHRCLLASAGVEKVVKVWSHFPMVGCQGDLYSHENFVSRKPYTHNEYLTLTRELGVQNIHNYDEQSVEEDSRMLAFFDSLIERNDFDDNSDSSDSETETVVVENILDVLLTRYTQSRNENRSDNESMFGVSLDELRRIFRSNRSDSEEETVQNSNTTNDKELQDITDNNKDDYDPHQPNKLESIATTKNVSNDDEQYENNRESHEKHHKNVGDNSNILHKSSCSTSTTEMKTNELDKPCSSKFAASKHIESSEKVEASNDNDLQPHERLRENIGDKNSSSIMGMEINERDKQSFSKFVSLESNESNGTVETNEVNMENTLKKRAVNTLNRKYRKQKDKK